MIDKKEFIFCPACHKKTRIRTLKDTQMKNFPLFCQWCKRVHIVDFESGKLTVKGILEH